MPNSPPLTIPVPVPPGYFDANGEFFRRYRRWSEPGGPLSGDHSDPRASEPWDPVYGPSPYIFENGPFYVDQNPHAAGMPPGYGQSSFMNAPRQGGQFGGGAGQQPGSMGYGQNPYGGGQPLAPGYGQSPFMNAPPQGGQNAFGAGQPGHMGYGQSPHMQPNHVSKGDQGWGQAWGDSQPKKPTSGWGQAWGDDSVPKRYGGS